MTSAVNGQREKRSFTPNVKVITTQIEVIRYWDIIITAVIIISAHDLGKNFFFYFCH